MKWYSKYLQVYEKPFAEAPQKVIEEVRRNLAGLQSNEPLVTVSLIGYNEEKHLLACLWSLSEMKCKYPVEIIGVDNESKDRTAEIYEACGVTYFTETQHSCGFARLCGLNQARGKYHINIDSDTMYPPKYVETMVDALEKPGIVAASSLWSYIPDKDHSWLGLKIYESTRDLHLWLQSFKRPELSVRGLVFAYRTEYARKTGIRTDIIRGEDGYLALQLKQFGKIAFVRKRRARAVTGYGTVGADGSLFNSFKVRVISRMKEIGGLFTKKKEYKDEESNLVKRNKNTRITRTINSIIVLFLYITTISCIKNKNLYDDSLAEKKVISNPEFLYPYINEPISHTAEITIHIKEGVRQPTLSDAVIPPLKYNKSWLFMLTQDDCRHAAFCYTWAAINGKPLSKKSFYDLPHLQTNDLPSDCYYLGKTLGCTDGAENEVRFSFATTLAPEEKWMDNVTTINKKDNGFHEQNGLVWGNVKEMLNFGIGIAFHDVMATDINNPNDILAHYEIAQNIILNRLGRGCKMLAEPNGNKNYVEAAHNYPVIKTFTLQTGGERIHPFEDMLNLENKLIERIFFNNHNEIKEKIVNELSYPCEQREIIYAGVHGTDTSWAEFLLWLNDTYGQDGDDSMWMPSQEEYYEYNHYQVHGTTEVNYENEHTIKLTVHLPGQEYFYYPSVTVNLSGIKKEDIKQISSNDEVTGLSYANYENGIMFNIDCRKYLAEHAENFVKRYETNPTSVSAKADALYFVNMLKDSDKKTELKKRVE